MTHIPLCDLQAEYRLIKGEVDDAVLRVLSSGQYILGPEVESFEREAADYLGVRHAVAVANGSDALYLALRALDIGPGDEVIVPAFTFFATAGAVVRAGATPVFADVHDDTFNIDAADAASRVSPRTKAIIPVHLYGQAADMAEIEMLARERRLHVIEDAAQAFGAAYRGRKVGGLGDAGCFSFFPTKNLGCYGDGGMVTMDNDGLAGRLRLLRAHGARPKYHHHLVGINSRLDALQAAVLRVKLKHVDTWNERRRRVADAYDAALRATGLAGRVASPARRPDRTHVFHQYTVRLPERLRDDVKRALEAAGIGCAVYYPGTLPEQPALSAWVRDARCWPLAERLARQVLSLPMGVAVEAGVGETVVAAIRQVIGVDRTVVAP